MIRHIEDVSLVDYPEHVASVLFYENCNLRCPYCHNPELLSPGNGLYFMDVLKKLKENRLIDGVVFTGGEPLLTNGLAYDLAQIDALGLDIKLDTNGLLTSKLKNVFILLDYIAMDIKSDKWGYKHLGATDLDFTMVQASIKAIMDSGIDYEFRCTAVDPFLTERSTDSIGKLVEGAKLFYIQQPNLVHVLNPAFSMRPTENLIKIKDILSSYVNEVIIR